MDAPVNIKSLENMPDELVVRILKNLDPCSLTKLCLASKRYSKLCQDYEVWKALYKRDIMDKKPCIDWG